MPGGRPGISWHTSAWKQRNCSVYANDRREPKDPRFKTARIIGDKTVRADAADATSGVATVEFLVDGVVRFTDADAPYEFLWAAGEEPRGTHTLEVRVTDYAGNVASASIVVETAPAHARR